MKIQKDHVASLTYTLKIDDELIEQTDAANPLTFLVGTGAMIPGFERQLLGKEAGEHYDFTVTPEEGYGALDPDAVVDLSKEVFVVNGELQEEMLVEGNSIPMQDQDGQQLTGVVREVGSDTVKIDFNHQLAGKTLHFTGEIVEVRPATSDELAHGHVHGPGGHHH